MVVEEFVEGLAEGLDGAGLGKLNDLLVEEDQLENGHKYVDGAAELVEHLGAHLDELVRVVARDLSN